jgi:hypothetical protein
MKKFLISSDLANLINISWINLKYGFNWCHRVIFNNPGVNSFDS